MTIPIISNYLDQYKQNFQICEAGASEFGLIYEIFPPIFDKNNLGFSFYFQEKKDGNVIVTDLGSTLGEISILGLDITKNKTEYIQKICSLNDISFDQKTNEIYFEIQNYNQDIFNMKFQSYISSLIEIDCLRNAFNPKNIAKLFLEDLKQKFIIKNIDFNPKPTPIKGNFLNYEFDFSVRRKSDSKEIYAKVCKEINPENLEKIIMRKELAIAKNRDLPMLVISFNNFNETQKIKKLRQNDIEFLSKEKLYSANFMENSYKSKI